MDGFNLDTYIIVSAIFLSIVIITSIVTLVWLNKPSSNENTKKVSYDKNKNKSYDIEGDSNRDPYTIIEGSFEELVKYDCNEKNKK